MDIWYCKRNGTGFLIERSCSDCPYHQRDEGWCILDHAPDFPTETLRYDLETDSVLIEKRTVTPEQIAAQEKAAEDAALMKADTIRELQGKIAELESRLAKVEEGKI